LVAVFVRRATILTAMGKLPAQRARLATYGLVAAALVAVLVVLAMVLRLASSPSPAAVAPSSPTPAVAVAPSSPAVADEGGALAPLVATDVAEGGAADVAPAVAAASTLSREELGAAKRRFRRPRRGLGARPSGVVGEADAAF
jgi:hypothetical protein